MYVILAVVGVMGLGWLMADQVRQLPSSDAVAKTRLASISTSGLAIRMPGEVAPPAPVVADVAPTPEPQPVEPAVQQQPEPVVEERPRSNPVALVSLDPQTSRFPSRPSDPIGYALVLPAPIEGSQMASDLTGDVMQLRMMVWPLRGSQIASANPAELPSSPSSASNPSVPAAPVPAAATAVPPTTPAETPPAQVASVETPAAAETRGLPDKPVVETPAAAPAAAPTAAPAPVPAAASPTASPPTTAAVETPTAPARAATPRPAPRATTRTARTQPQQNLPAPPPRRLASAAPVGDDSRPTLACAETACGPKLLLLGIGF